MEQILKHLTSKNQRKYSNPYSVCQSSRASVPGLAVSKLDLPLSTCFVQIEKLVRLVMCDALQTETRQQAGLRKSIAAELEWVNANAKGQQKKGKARLRRYEDLTQQVCIQMPFYFQQNE